jgi:hypothetical protein
MLPNDTQRLAIVGRTGSGKTQAAAWHLSNRSYNSMPWIIYDFKYDTLLNEIEGIEEIDLSYIPKKPGLYIIHPLPDDQEKVEAHMWAVWQKENTGIYIDEGYMIGNSKALRALLTQGRSKHIPMIVLSQRPSWISRFLFSEADFYQIFWLNDIRDRKIVGSFVPFDMHEKLRNYHSIYYDVGNDKLYQWQPVPDKKTILATFSKRLLKRPKLI